MTGRAAASYRELAESLARLRNDGKSVGDNIAIRATVQVGHCSIAVGADTVAERLQAALAESVPLTVAGCDGACFDAPVVTLIHASGGSQRFSRVELRDVARIVEASETGPESSAVDTDDFFESQHRLALAGAGIIDPTSIDAYVSTGGYSGLARALEMTPEEVTQQVTASGLRGRGGAYFPAAAKWEAARKAAGARRHLIVNAEEGEPGVFKDRHLMDGVPHRVLEGAIIAAYASDVSEATFYVNAEAHLSADRMRCAIDQANKHGLIGDSVLGTDFNLSVDIVRGAGGYVCGEETALINTMEGYRREPRLRPPFPTEAGLWGRPTVINNVETLASVPFVLSEGPDVFAAIGTDDGAGTKIVSLSGVLKRPGVVEIPFGTTLRQIVFDIGAGPTDGSTIAFAGVGGPSSGLLPESMFDLPINPGMLHESGVMLGAGGVVVLDDRADPVEVVSELAAYNASESCGKCTPCREGAPRMVELLDAIVGGRGTKRHLEELETLAKVVNAASLCGLGQAAGNPVLSALRFFGDEFAAMVS